MAKNSYTYTKIDPRNKREKVHLSLKPEDQSLVDRATKNYESSKSWIHQKYVYIWKYAYKAYHLSTHDRQKVLKTWQSNIAWGLIRSFIDVFVSTLTERPITFSVYGLDEIGIQNADSIKYALAATADATWFQKESRYAMKEGLKTGTFAFYVGMLPDSKKKEMEVATNDQANPVEKITYQNQIGLFPYAKALDVFNVFPDVYNGTMRHCTWRQVTSIEGFIQNFDILISDPENRSPFKDIVPLLTSKENQNGADFKDYAVIKDQIHQQINYDFSTEDAFPDIFSNIDNAPPRVWASQDQDPEVTEGLIEYRFYAETNNIVIHANNYPVYIGPNPYGFIPFVLSSTTDEKRVIGCEGIPYLLSGMEKTLNSYMNNYLDNVKATATKTYIVRKGLFSDEDALENLEPWGVLFSEQDIGTTGVQAMDKWVVSDYNILEIVIKIASQLTGISEYNLGIAARERTASGAQAVTQSSQKRLSPFLETYVAVISRIAFIWLHLMREYWTVEKFVAIAWDQNGRTLKNKDLVGLTSITLNTDSMFAAIKDFAYKKILEVYTQTKGTGLINEDEVIREIFKLQWYDPKRFVPDSAPKVTEPTPPITPPEWVNPDLTDAQIEGYDIAQAVTPNVDLWNQWQWQ